MVISEGCILIDIISQSVPHYNAPGHFWSDYIISMKPQSISETNDD